MNQIDTAVTLPDGTEVITTAHLVIIVLLIVAAILVIWWGSRRRIQERREREQSEVDAAPEVDTTPARIVPPVTPPPPPLVEERTPVEPAAVTPAPVPEPVETREAGPPPAPAAAGGDTDRPVTLLKGLGPKVAARLGELGIATVGQMAALSPAEADALDAELGTFRGRMARDRWIEQAQLLAAGDRGAYEATFGKLG